MIKHHITVVYIFSKITVPVIENVCRCTYYASTITTSEYLMKFSGFVLSAVVLASSVSYSNDVAAARITDNGICKAALALTLNKSPRTINAVGLKGPKVLLSLKSKNKDKWEYSCRVNNKTVDLDGRKKRQDAFVDGLITYDVMRGKQKIAVTRDKKASGVTRKTYRFEELR